LFKIGLIRKLALCMFNVPFDGRRVSARADQREAAGQTNVPFHNFFRKNSGKVLTEKNENVSLETFPSLGSGSLKFTLCD